MKGFLSTTLTAFLLTGGAAQAATLDITLGPSITYSYNASEILPASNVDVSDPSKIHLVDNAQIIPAGNNKTLYWTAPAGITGSNYLAVLGLTPDLKHDDKGEAFFTLGSGNDHLGFTWGTIDTYNSLEIMAGPNKYTITGANILNALTGAIAGTTQVNVEIDDPVGNIHKAIFTSTGNTFELGNISQTDTPAPTPLPAAWLLFSTGLIGLVLMGRQKFIS